MLQSSVCVVTVMHESTQFNKLSTSLKIKFSPVYANGASVYERVSNFNTCRNSLQIERMTVYGNSMV